ncbi:MAG: GTP-binding protein [Gammaproteobacteria bacterium]|nr:GTP-binding protein [Gammaproteobacteria bacterium]
MKACKICMVGDFAVGKTSLVARYVHSRFSDAYLTTVGVKIDTRTLTVPSGEEIKLVLWDIAGKSELAGIDTNYLRDASAYLLVADTTRAETLDSVFKLQQQVERQLGAKPFSLLLNKSDLGDRQAVSEEQLARLSGDDWAYSRTSALTGDGVEHAFAQLGARLVHRA